MKIQSAQSQASQIIAPTKGKDSDGDNDGSSSKAPSSAKVGPAVLLSLTNTAQATKPDLAAGDPDHDGK